MTESEKNDFLIDGFPRNEVRRFPVAEQVLMRNIFLLIFYFPGFRIFLCNLKSNRCNFIMFSIYLYYFDISLFKRDEILILFLFQNVTQGRFQGGGS